MLARPTPGAQRGPRAVQGGGPLRGLQLSRWCRPQCRQAVVLGLHAHLYTRTVSGTLRPGRDPTRAPGRDPLPRVAKINTHGFTQAGPLGTLLVPHRGDGITRSETGCWYNAASLPLPFPP